MQGLPALHRLFSCSHSGGICYRKFTGLALLLTVLLWSLSAAASETCPPRFAPGANSDALYIADADWRRMQALRDRLGDCPQLAADFALVYFWGRRDLPADLQQSWQLAQRARDSVAWLDQLRLLRSVYVLAGLSAEYSVEEALRRLRGEFSRESAIYADKVMALLNQLLLWLPLREVASGAGELALALPQGGLLVADAQGQPRWRDGQGAVPSSRRPQALFYDRGGRQRLRLWRPPLAQPGSWVVGLLHSDYGEAGDAHCTATAVAERWLITAAHCLFAATAESLLARQVRFYPQPLQQPMLFLKPRRAWLLANHHHQLLRGDIDAYSGSDLALLELPEPLPGEVLFADLAVANLASQAVFSLSYPNDTAPRSLWLSLCQAAPLPGHRGAAMVLLGLNCQNSAGQSGALIWSDDLAPRALGLLSANLWRGERSQSVAAGFSKVLLADIQRIMAGETPRLTEWNSLYL